MRGFTIKVLGVALSAFAGGLAVLRYLTDWIGRSTVPEDAEALLQKAGVAMVWLSEQPSVIFYWIPVSLILTSLLLAFQPEIVELITAKANKEEKMRALGERCLKLARDIRSVGGGRGIILNGRQNSTWAKYLPIAVEIESMGLETPPGAFDNTEEIDDKEKYLEFVGNLLLHNQFKTAKVTASNLSADRNQLSEATDNQ